MGDKNIKSALQEHYQNLELNQSQLDSLQKTMGSKNTSARKWRLIHTQLTTLAAVVLFGVFIAYSDWNNIDRRVVKEVAYNHVKSGELGIKTTALAEVQAKLTRLNFQIIKSSFVPSNMSLVGGKYCSIQGIEAAQLKYMDHKAGKAMTLYQVSMDHPQFKQIKPHQIKEINGVRVKIWQEKGLLVASAE